MILDKKAYFVFLLLLLVSNFAFSETYQNWGTVLRISPEGYGTVMYNRTIHTDEGGSIPIDLTRPRSIGFVPSNTTIIYGNYHQFIDYSRPPILQTQTIQLSPNSDLTTIIEGESGQSGLLVLNGLHFFHTDTRLVNPLDNQNTPISNYSLSIYLPYPVSASEAQDYFIPYITVGSSSESPQSFSEDYTWSIHESQNQTLVLVQKRNLTQGAFDSDILISAIAVKKPSVSIIQTDPIDLINQNIQRQFTIDNYGPDPVFYRSVQISEGIAVSSNCTLLGSSCQSLPANNQSPQLGIPLQLNLNTTNCEFSLFGISLGYPDDCVETRGNYDFSNQIDLTNASTLFEVQYSAKVFPKDGFDISSSDSRLCITPATVLIPILISNTSAVYTSLNLSALGVGNCVQPPRMIVDNQIGEFSSKPASLNLVRLDNGDYIANSSVTVGAPFTAYRVYYEIIQKRQFMDWFKLILLAASSLLTGYFLLKKMSEENSVGSNIQPLILTGLSMIIVLLFILPNLSILVILTVLVCFVLGYYYSKKTTTTKKKKANKGRHSSS